MTETTKSTTNPRSFGSWLNAQAKRDDPVGDLARDVRTDRRHNCMTARTVRGMRRHLVSVHGASFGARSALDRAEAEYEAQCATSSAPTVRSAS